jgi:transposase
MAPALTGSPGYHPSVLLKLFIYGYLNRVPSSRALEREAGRNVKVMWLTGRLSEEASKNSQQREVTRVSTQPRLDSVILEFCSVDA